MASALVRTLGALAITVASAFPVLAPARLFADDKDPLATLLFESGEAPLGELRASAIIRRDARAKSGWSVEVVVDNPDDAPHAARIAVSVSRSFFNPASRTGSTPVDVFTSVVAVDVQPRLRVTRVVALPASIGAEMDQSAAVAVGKAIALEKAAGKGEAPPTWAFGITGSPRRTWRAVVREPGTR